MKTAKSSPLTYRERRAFVRLFRWGVSTEDLCGAFELTVIEADTVLRDALKES